MTKEAPILQCADETLVLAVTAADGFDIDEVH